MRSAGKKVGMIKLRAFRPFPKDKLASLVDSLKAKMVVVLEKDRFGALFDEVRSALYNLDSQPQVMGFGVGFNGRDVSPYNIIDLAEKGFKGIGSRSLPRTSQLYFIRKREQED
jgi:pyruvate ferredoxin oxidoreductase alpha subunit